MASNAACIRPKLTELPGRPLAGGITNLVVFNGQLTASDMLQIYDPAESLPKNQDSWR